MPYADHLKITASGILGSVATPIDEFSYSINMSVLLTQANANWEAAVKDAIVAFHGRAGTMICSQAILRQVKIAHIGPDGKYVGDGPLATFAVNTPGNAPWVGLPYQCALAVSLGAQGDSRRAKGRFYLPLPCTPAGDVTNTIPLASQNSIADSVKTLLDTLNDAVSDVDRVVVASSLDGNHYVNTIRVGNVVDTIRSRRNQTPEVYQLRAIAD